MHPDKIHFLLILLILCFVSCEKQDESPQIFQGNIVEIQAPDQMGIGEFAPMEVFFMGHGCFNEHHLEVIIEDTNILIQAFYFSQNPYILCPEDPPPLKLVYMFEAKTRKTYLVKSNDTGHVTDTILVE